MFLAIDRIPAVAALLSLAVVLSVCRAGITAARRPFRGEYTAVHALVAA